MNMITMKSPLGVLRLYGHADELVGVYLPDQEAPHRVTDRSGPNASSVPSAPHQTSAVLEATAAQLEEYFAGERRDFDLPPAPRGTGFQQIVWRALVGIPYGETRSYGSLAHAIGRPSASRAVGAANGKNPISIIVPCHRVIAASGELTGYAGGLAAKRWLLAHELRYLGSAHAAC